jgi:hypothetical protein
MNTVGQVSGKVLVCPGIKDNSHPFRCVPVIKILREYKLEVLIAAWTDTCTSLLIEFPDLEKISFPGCIRKTSPGGNSLLKALSGYLAKSLHRRRIRKQIDSVATEKQILLVISDGLDECRSKMARSVLLMQSRCKNAYGFSNPGKKILARQEKERVNRFDECWIPDVETLNGLLTANPPEIGQYRRAVHIGILSRFTLTANDLHTFVHPVFDLLILLSGPEPYRSELEQKVLNQIINLNLQIAIVRGVPGTGEATMIDGRIHIFPELSAGHLSELISQSAMIICRTDCDHVADVITMGKRAIFVPVPGDQEQEALARSLMAKKIYFSLRQIHFDLLYALEMSVNYPGMVIRNDLKALRERIKALMLSP